MREEKRDETLDKIKRMIVKEENIFYLHFILELIKELLIHALKYIFRYTRIAFIPINSY